MSEGQKDAGRVTGLTDGEAAAIRKTAGRNTVHRGKKQNPLKLFAGQLGDLMTMILLVCAGLSVLMGEGTEALAMIVIVLVNALIGFLQEYRTERTLEALTRLAAPTARVIRQGVRREIPAEELVPGDLVLIAAGDKIPADCRIVGDGTVSCDESLLTGESVPVEKSRLGDSSLRMGTLAVKGNCQAEVTAIGMQTEMGKIAGMLEEIAPEMTPLAQRLEQLGKVIAAGCLGICAVVAAIGIFRGENPFDMILMGISLAVAAVPEGLPAIVTVALALAVRRILRRGTLVKSLHAVETLGCAQVICTDKTGTLTQNRMTVRELWTAGGELEVTGEGDSRDGTFIRGGRQAMELRADEALLLRAIENLLHNTVGHNAAPVHVTIRADAADNMLTIQVTDDGQGYPPAVLAVLQAGETGENPPHILGLHVVEQILAAHGGTAAFAQALPHGAAAALTLPL